jgi:hypothetical protein
VSFVFRHLGSEFGKPLHLVAEFAEQPQEVVIASLAPGSGENRVTLTD